MDVIIFTSDLMINNMKLTMFQYLVEYGYTQSVRVSRWAAYGSITSRTVTSGWVHLSFQYTEWAKETSTARVIETNTARKQNTTTALDYTCIVKKEIFILEPVPVVYFIRMFDFNHCTVVVTC